MADPPALRILILADDLSGAADCGVACARAGLETEVALHPTAPAGTAAALALDLDSRHRSAAEAADTVRAAAARLMAPGSAVYVKIDSTLRGEPGAHIAAALGATPGAHLAIVAPAFPAAGRIMRDGRVMVGGVPLDRTEMWRREGRAADPDLVAMLRAAGVPARVVKLAVVRSGALADDLRRAPGAVVCDAETDADLAAIAAAGTALGAAVVWAGSAGLARPLARGLPPVGAGGRRCVATRRDGPVLAVVGSLSLVARAQMAELGRSSGASVVAVPPDALRGGSPACADAARRLSAALDAAGDGGLVAVSVAGDPTPDTPPAPAVCAALARLIVPHLHRAGGLLLTGGETARAVLGLAGVVTLRLTGEIEAGVPLAMAAGTALPVVTKAGAFGDAGTLRRGADVLRTLPRMIAREDA